MRAGNPAIRRPAQRALSNSAPSTRCRTRRFQFEHAAFEELLRELAHNGAPVATATLISTPRLGQLGSPAEPERMRPRWLPSPERR